MGKVRKPKIQRQNIDPIGLMNAIANDELEPRENPIQAIQEQLQSANNEDKMCGLQTLSMLAQNENRVALILSSDVVRIAAPLLVDQDQNIRHSAAGPLRNLSAVSVDVCERLVELDLATPLLVLLNQYATSDWVPVVDKDGHMDQRSDVFLQAVNIIWNMCESTSLALETFNQSQLLRSFVKCLNFQVYGIEIAISVAQALLVISEDNSATWNVLTEFSNDLLALLALDGDHSKLTLAAFTAGIIANVPALSAAHFSQILTTISKTLDINQKQVLCNVSSKIPLDQKEPQNIELELQDETQMEEETTEELEARRKKMLPTTLDLEVRQIELLMLAQRIAAETLTNICCSDEGSDQSMEDSDSDSVNEFGTEVQDCDKLPVEMFEALRALGLVEKLWQRSQPIPENVQQILQSSPGNGRNLLKRYIRLRTSILIALQSLCSVLTIEDLGGAAPVYTVWLELGQQVFQGQPDSAIVEASTGLMRAVLDHLKNHRNLFQQMNSNDLELILKGIDKCQKSEIRANWLKMLGALGCVLPEPLVKVILEFMVQMCHKEEDCWTISEGMDAFMDIFADNDWPQLVKQLQLSQKCKEIDRGFKAKIRQNKKALSDRYGAVNTVKSNLARFCKYLEDLERN